MQRERDESSQRLRAHKLRVHVARVAALETAQVLPADWRSWTAYDLEKCVHVHRRLMEVENDYGAWEVEVCVNCGEQVHKHCPHHHNSWNEDETVLTCDNCGADGT